MDTRPLFTNASLSDKYIITGADNEIHIQNKELAFKGPLSRLDEKRIQYRIGRGCKLVALKPAGVSKPLTTPHSGAGAGQKS